VVGYNISKGLDDVVIMYLVARKLLKISVESDLGDASVLSPQRTSLIHHATAGSSATLLVTTYYTGLDSFMSVRSKWWYSLSKLPRASILWSCVARRSLEGCR
jgi:hypothetical protein